MTDISSHPLLQQAYDVCQAIEKCGATVLVTDAVGQAMDLLHAIDAHLHAARVEPAAQKSAELHLSEARAPFYETMLGAGTAGGMLDPLEQAIESTVRMLRDEAASLLPDVTGDTLSCMAVYGRMVEHLNSLLAAQLARVSRHE